MRSGKMPKAHAFTVDYTIGKEAKEGHFPGAAVIVRHAAKPGEAFRVSLLHPFGEYHRRHRFGSHGRRLCAAVSAAAFKQERNYRMNRMNWKDMPPAHKIAAVIAGIAFAFWVIAQVKPDLLPIDPTCISIAVVSLCEAVIYWKEKRKWAWLLIAAAVICMACVVLDFMLL